MYRFLYNCVFCLAFMNFLIYWIDLFFSSERYQNFDFSKPEKNGIFNIFLPLKNYTDFQASQNWSGQFLDALFPFSRKKENNALPVVPHHAKRWGGTQTNYLSSQASSVLTPQIKRWGSFQNLLFLICSLLWFTLTLLIFFRVTQSNHFPLANFYEALIFLTWCLVTLNFIILLEPTRSLSFQFSVQKQVSGAVLAPCILFIIAFAQFNLSSDITPLVPALKSNWLLMHVSIMICSYTTFMVGGLLSLLLLIQTVYSYVQTWTMAKKPYNQEFSNNSSISSYVSSSNAFKRFPFSDVILEGPYKMQKKNFYILLDNLSYRMMGIGFPLFTLGILSGAVWANEAWGSYWSWDIKEVGSFINWLLVALYFHCRYKNFVLSSHMVAFVSLMVLFFNFFGISLGIFGSSLHAYGASS